VKRVRALAGAAGLAPLGIILTPGIAQASVPGQHVGQAKKSVRAHVTAGADRQAPNAWGIGCTGSSPVTVNGTWQRMNYWWALWASNGTAPTHVCIGTVKDHESLLRGNGHRFRLRIWSRFNASHQHLAFQQFYNGTQHTNSISAIAPVHQAFGSSAYPYVMVCGTWVSTNGQTEISTVCGTQRT